MQFKVLLPLILVLACACTKPLYEGPRRAKHEVALLTRMGWIEVHSLDGKTDLPLVWGGNYELVPGVYRIIVGLDENRFKTNGYIAMSFKAEAGHRYQAEWVDLDVSRPWTARVRDLGTKATVSTEMRYVSKDIVR